MSIFEDERGLSMLDERYYTGTDQYSDGEVEDDILQICRNKKIEEALHMRTEWPILYHLSPLRENLLEWYPIQKNESVLEIGSGCGALSGLLAKKAKQVTCVELSRRRSLINACRNSRYSNLKIMVGNLIDISLEDKFDYVTMIGVLEYAPSYIHTEKPFHDLVRLARSYLKPNGKLIIAIENKMGLKYLNGASEDHLGIPYGGVNDYVGQSVGIRTFSKQELETLLHESGVKEWQFYYPMPDYKLPKEIYTDLYQPKAGDIRYYKSNYDAPRSYSFNEAIVFDQICCDGMFSYFANSFLVVCGEKSNCIQYVKYSCERRQEYCLVTNISSSGEIAEKHSKGKLSAHSLKNMTQYADILASEHPNIQVLRGNYCGSVFSYSRIYGKKLDEILFSYRHDIQGFIDKTLECLDKYYTYDPKFVVDFKLTEAFREVFGEKAPHQAISLKVTNVDFLFHNIIVQQKTAYLIDYEWVFDFPIPYDYVRWRTLIQLFNKYRMYFSKEDTFEKYRRICGVSDELDEIFRCMEIHFMEYVHGEGRYAERYLKPAYTSTTRLLYM